MRDSPYILKDFGHNYRIIGGIFETDASACADNDRARQCAALRTVAAEGAALLPGKQADLVEPKPRWRFHLA
jgi:hypothetical protein